MKQTYKQDKGVAGLTILLSVIVMLFVIGLLIMIFSLMSSELQSSTYTETAGTVTNEDHLVAEIIAGDELDGVSGLRNSVCSIVSVRNETADGTVLLSGNYSLTGGCDLANATEILDLAGGVTKWVVNYTYVYDNDNTATDVMNSTSSALGGAVDWFDIFIVITAMIVLILLTVIIITAIRSSGMIAGGGRGTNQIGTA